MEARIAARWPFAAHVYAPRIGVSLFTNRTHTPWSTYNISPDPFTVPKFIDEMDRLEELAKRLETPTSVCLNPRDKQMIMQHPHLLEYYSASYANGCTYIVDSTGIITSAEAPNSIPYIYLYDDQGVEFRFELEAAYARRGWRPILNKLNDDLGALANWRKSVQAINSILPQPLHEEIVENLCPFV